MKYRNQQVAKDILRAMNESLIRLHGLEKFGLVTITDVVVNPGIDNAKIFVSSFNHPQELVKRLNSKTSFFYKELGKKIKIRKLPTITFEVDIRPELFKQLE